MMWNKIQLYFWTFLDSWVGKTLFVLLIISIIGLIVVWLGNGFQSFIESAEISAWLNKSVSDMVVRDFVFLIVFLVILQTIFVRK